MNIDLPAATPTDPSDVVIALQTAHALWRSGDAKDALRWIRRAAEAAEVDGDDLRAVTLARAAADLQDLLPASPSVPPPSQRPSAPPMAAPPAPPPPTPPVEPLAEQQALADGPTDPAIQVSAPAPEASAPFEATPTQAFEAPAPPVETTPLVEPAPLEATPAETTPGAVPSATIAARPALRVSVEVLSRGSGTFVVRLLGDGEAPPERAHEALLVPLESGVDLREA